MGFVHWHVLVQSTPAPITMHTLYNLVPIWLWSHAALEHSTVHYVVIIRSLSTWLSLPSHPLRLLLHRAFTLRMCIWCALWCTLWHLPPSLHSISVLAMPSMPTGSICLYLKSAIQSTWPPTLQVAMRYTEQSAYTLLHKLTPLLWWGGTFVHRLFSNPLANVYMFNGVIVVADLVWISVWKHHSLSVNRTVRCMTPSHVPKLTQYLLYWGWWPGKTRQDLPLVIVGFTTRENWKPCNSTVAVANNTYPRYLRSGCLSQDLINRKPRMSEQWWCLNSLFANAQLLNPT